MKKIYFTTLLALLTFTAYTQSVIINNNKNYTAKFVSAPPVIDGVINEDAWLNATFGGYNTITGMFPESLTNKINLADGGTLSGPPPANPAPDYFYNNTCTFALAWDDDWLYFATEVKDSAVVANPLIEYAEAGIELYINNGNGRSGVSDPINENYPRKYNNLKDMHVQLWHVPAGNAVSYPVLGDVIGLANYGISLPPSQYVFAVKRTTNGYIYEGKIAWIVINKEFIDENTGLYNDIARIPQNGRTIGFDLGNSIVNSPPGRDAELMWNQCCFNVNWTRSKYYGSVMLSDPINQSSIKKYNYVTGTVFEDLNNDCILQSDEHRIPDILVTTTIAGSVYYALSDASGTYQLRLDAENVNMDVSIIISDDQFYKKTSCTLANVNLGTFSNVYTGINVPVNSLHCSKKEFDENQCSKYDSTNDVVLVSNLYASDGKRRCRENGNVIILSNYGSATASNVGIIITFPGEVFPISIYSPPNSNFIDVPYTIVSDQIWSLTVPSIAPMTKKFISIRDSVKCLDETYLGRTICTNIELISAHKPLSLNWDKSNLEILNSCSSDSVKFTVQNTGLGDMSDSTNLYIFSNSQLTYKGKVKFKTNEWISFSIPLTNNISLKVYQTKYHPLINSVETLIDGCSKIFRNVNYKDHSNNSSYSIITDSQDPNDKSASINGLPNREKILPGQKIDYTIEFQNTGNDTAYKVVVVDTLDHNLDLTSLKMINADHDYKLDISTSANGKKVLTWTFNHIMLPDSTTDLAHSTGRILFSIYPKSGISYGTTIKNKAGIYFDYNSPIITNETVVTIMDTLHLNVAMSHKIKVQYSSKTLGIISEGKTEIKVYPNPVQSELNVEITKFIPSESFEIYSVQGQKIYQSVINNERFVINLQSLPNGIYVWKYGTSRGKLSKE